MPELTYSGTQALQVDPASVADALTIFDRANEQVKARISELQGTHAIDWAGDPVSAETATKFNQRSTGYGSDSALLALTGYQRQLQAAVETLQKAKETYQANDATAEEGMRA